VKQVRLLPVVVMAASALLVLKTFGIVSGQGYILGGVGIAQEVEHTAPVPEDQSELSPSEAAARALFDTVPSSVSGEGEVNVLAAGPGGVAVPVDFTEGTSEAAILQRLAERRAELEAFAGELEARLAVVEAAEIRIEERMAELNAMETSINALVDAQENAEGEQFGAVVAMYENMRASDAATIFNDLDRDVLVRVGKAMNPRKLGPIMAEMNTARAQELTVLLTQTGPTGPAEIVASDYANLPQIVGQ
jgi:flagellar motility protein MotE (MotC chaperone)